MLVISHLIAHCGKISAKLLAVLLVLLAAVGIHHSAGACGKLPFYFLADGKLTSHLLFRYFGSFIAHLCSSILGRSGLRPIFDVYI